MSYTDDRDDLAELLGIEPKPKKGYSEEIQESRPAAKPAKPAAKTTPPPAQKQAAPAPRREAIPEPRQSAAEKVEVKKPVKLRPPAHIAPPTGKKPASAPQTIVEDEEISIYSETAPDLTEFDFSDLEQKPVKRKN